TVAKLTGWPVAELIGKTEAEIFFRNSKNGQSNFTSQNPDEQLLSRKDGTCFPVEFVKTSINEGGRVIGSVLVFKDITERKRVEETLRAKRPSWLDQTLNSSSLLSSPPTICRNLCGKSKLSATALK